MKKSRKGLAVLLIAVLLVLGGLACRRPLMQLYRDIRFQLSDPTETELKVKAYADKMGISSRCSPPNRFRQFLTRSAFRRVSSS